ncbi:hypothetical protein E2542_SST09589 [Spatholobus suberectus]|nr:hypothetical protein E2542_SST09589 [Spatholobus suberectus]
MTQCIGSSSCGLEMRREEGGGGRGPCACMRLWRRRHRAASGGSAVRESGPVMVLVMAARMMFVCGSLFKFAFGPNSAQKQAQSLHCEPHSSYCSFAGGNYWKNKGKSRFPDNDMRDIDLEFGPSNAAKHEPNIG